MKFSKYDYELNQIDLPESMRGSLEPSEGSTKLEEQPTTYEEVEEDTSLSNQGWGSPPTQMDVEPIERTPTTPIDNQLLHLAITEPPMEEMTLVGTSRHTNRTSSHSPRVQTSIQSVGHGHHSDCH
jgi:hypothetical protein